MDFQTETGSRIISDLIESLKNEAVNLSQKTARFVTDVERLIANSGRK